MEWREIDENTPQDVLHLRGHWVRRLLPDGSHVTEWQFGLGYVTDAGDFIDTNGNDFGWAADDYTHWLSFVIPEPPQ